MSNWGSYSIGDIAQVFDGPHATPEKTKHGPWFLSISSLDSGRLKLIESAHLSEEDFACWTRRVTPEPGDVLFSYETRLGEAALVPEGVRACLGRRMGLLRPNRKLVDPNFLLFAYLSPEFQATIQSRKIHGATVDRIPLVDLPKWSIHLPHLTEQRAIAAVLGALDDKIALNGRIVSACADLMSLRFATNVWDYARRRDLPEDYSEGRVQDLCERIGNGGTPKRNNPTYWENGKIDWYKTGELNDGPLIESSEQITDLGLDESSCSLWEAGTVLVALYASPTVGRLGILTRSAAFNQACSGLKARETIGEFALFETIKAIRADLQGIAVGAAQQNISKAVLSTHRLVVPSVEASKRFHNFAGTLYRRQLTAMQESRTLGALRDTLLPQLMSGKLRVRDAEWIVEDAL